MNFAYLAVLCGAVLLLLILVQAVYVRIYQLRLAEDILGEKDRSFQPCVSVLLCLRGHDPSLEGCLRSLLAQRYESFRLVCVFDSEHDPAWNVVRQFHDDARLSMTVAGSRGPSRSLKCNSLIHAFDAIEDPVTVLVDADTNVDPDWLADLVAPLANADVVASSGNRWFIPPAKELGSHVRYFWNMAAAPQMFVYQVTWGGSLALKTEFVRTSGLLDAWSKSLFEDAAVPAFARRQKKRVVMVPALLIPNQESVLVSGAADWIKRQLLDTRLYHRCFSLVVGHALLVATTLGGTVVATILCLVFGMKYLALALAACLLLYALFYWWAWFQLEATARLALQERGHEIESRKPGGPIAWLAIVVAQVVYTASVWQALWARRVTWRGIDYVIRKPFDVEMVEYREMTGRTSGESL